MPGAGHAPNSGHVRHSQEMALMWAVPPMNSSSLDAWLYQADPVDGCDGCSAAMARLEAAMRANDATARFNASADVRNHPNHQAEAPR
ncbi:MULTISPECIES: hypothetical protein [unclassified Streptomyces]|uniref:hypothetical protein n=1 Tax=unclassified Streptomyces TaxID=2593676 RepID=UPI0038228957